MLYELRVYECNPGMLPAIVKRFADHTVALFDKHGIKNIGYWTTEVGTSNHELTYIVAFDDAAQREKAWASFRADPAWPGIVEESHINGVIVKNVRNQLLTPTAYSPLQ